ncbi:MAG: hypothetical protein JNJ89_00935 [Rubrivivax sp.]|nr:hypothetical protein [Rubrivivax sp.]
MNAPWSPEVLLRLADDGQASLPLGADGVARWVWQSRFGAMLIEVIDGAVFVNGARVQPHVGTPGQRPPAPSTSSAAPAADAAATSPAGRPGPQP